MTEPKVELHGVPGRIICAVARRGDGTVRVDLGSGFHFILDDADAVALAEMILRLARVK